MSELLGRILIERSAISEPDLDKALQIQAELGGRIGAVLLRIGAVSEDVLLEALSEQLGIPVIGEVEHKAPTAAEIVSFASSKGISVDWMIDQQAIIWGSAGVSEVCLASKDPLSVNLLSCLDLVLPGCEPELFLITQQALDGTLNELSHSGKNTGLADAHYLKELAEEAPVVELVNSIFSQAMDMEASDIHVEPGEDQFVIRYRIDGILTTHLTLPKSRFDSIATRIKLIADIDIAEKRLPQDGRVSTRASGEDVDIRVSTLPGVYGESIVMRLLPKERKKLSLSTLGLFDDHLAQLNRWIQEPHGIILVTGPTGSGKSTTLYTALDESNDGVKKIITVEDPVEFRLKGITQVQANADIGLTFSSALRSILRQDPDVVMVGEIRDLETAEIAVQAALTGHLVFSTLHTNDSIGAFTRLIDMGIEPFLVATPIIATQAQRLVRRLCEKCAIPAELLPAQAKKFADLPGKFRLTIKPNWRTAVGCPACNGTGFKGRIGIYEMIDVTPEVQSLIVEGASSAEMYKLVSAQGFRTLFEDGILKAMSGLTSLEEVMRVTRASESGES